MPNKSINPTSQPNRNAAFTIAAPSSPVPTWKAEQYSDKPIFFWRPDEDYGFFCQWYLAPFEDDRGQTFNCCEQYMMWHKAKTFDDTATMAAVMKEKSPRRQKALGRQVKGFADDIWDREKYAVVLQASLYKFAQCNARDDDAFVYPPDGWLDNGAAERVPLRDILLSTGKRELAEASRFDRVWGIGFDLEAARRTKRSAWGQNLLGQALMEARTILSGESDGQNVGLAGMRE